MIDDINNLYLKVLENDRKKSNSVESLIHEQVSNENETNEPFDDFLLKLGEKLQANIGKLNEKDELLEPESDNGEELTDFIVPNNYVGEMQKSDKLINKKIINEKDNINTIISEQIQEEIGKVKTQISRMAIEGGGGSVAVQYANGGTMNGDLNVTGKYLSGGIDLSTLIGSGGGVSLTGYTDRLVSGSEVFKLNSDGTFDFPNNIITPQDETILTLESTKLLDNYHNRLSLTPYGFFASDHNENSITIDSTENTILIDSQDTYHWKFNSVGEMEGPFGTLSVNGNISASEVVYASGGNSNIWNNLNTTVVNNSASWSNPRTLYALVYNADTVRLERGTVVYSFGATGDTMSVKRASNTSEATCSKTLGFVKDPIEIGQTGYVTVQGRIERINFDSPFVQGDTLWLGSSAGSYTREEPISPLHSVYLGVVERANQGNGIAYVKVQNGYEIEELHNVLITNVLSGQILKRNEANNLWVNAEDNSVKTSSSSMLTNGVSAITTILAVSALPASPDPSTFYIII
jgi:hypothetical protein